VHWAIFPRRDRQAGEQQRHGADGTERERQSLQMNGRQPADACHARPISGGLLVVALLYPAALIYSLCGKRRPISARTSAPPNDALKSGQSGSGPLNEVRWPWLHPDKYLP
jgi:hypothetical protein